MFLYFLYVINIRMKNHLLQVILIFIILISIQRTLYKVL